MKTLFPSAYVLNVMADDRPGIVAHVSGVVFRAGGNIDACSQTVMGGYFTQILVVSFPMPVVTADLVAMLQKSPANGGALHVVMTPYVAPVAVGQELTERFVVTAFGTDRPGIIHRFSQYLAGKDINIVDLYWDNAGEGFVLVTQVALPVRLDLALLQADLEEMARDEGYNVRLQHENIFIATNQLRLAGAHHGR
jgi:glycine cleavage system transcriptional repressor